MGAGISLSNDQIINIIKRDLAKEYFGKKYNKEYNIKNNKKYNDKNNDKNNDKSNDKNNNLHDITYYFNLIKELNIIKENIKNKI
jgi:hypothetical protein